MSNQLSPLELNTFVRGLITEASPLTFPDNASIKELNFELSADGSRRRRLGMELEAGSIDQLIPYDKAFYDNTIPTIAYEWNNVMGDATNNLVVVSVANTVTFFKASSNPLSSGYLNSIALTEKFNSIQFATVDGLLVGVTDSGDKPHVFKYDEGQDRVLSSSVELRIRDLFGVEAKDMATDLNEGSNVSIRPTAITGHHLYNLRNQSWGVPKLVKGGGATREDPVKEFKEVSKSLYPSNADAVNQAFYADTEDTSNRTGKRVHVADLINDPIGSMKAAQGYFIINAFDRGASRINELNKLKTKYNEITDLEITDYLLPKDITPAGIKCITEYAGRVFYGGFSGEITTGDNRSPRMSSYVLFSKLVSSASDIGVCYQDGDPTSVDSPDILDTDGGFIRLDGAYNICRFAVLGQNLVVFAENGVWTISGGSDYSFKATDYLVRKVSEQGTTFPHSVVVVEGKVLYWSENGIYSLEGSDIGGLTATNITNTTIKQAYDAISLEDKSHCSGRYDTYERKVRWMYSNAYSNGVTSTTKGLVLDVVLGSFSMTEIHNPPTGVMKVVDYVPVRPFPVAVGTESSYKELKYLVVTDQTSDSSLKIGFASYSNKKFKDWNEVDAAAHMITGYVSGGDFQRRKQIPYATFHFNATDTTWTTDSNGDLVVTNPSSCLARVMWNWTNDPISGKWGSKFQAYRHKRAFANGPAGGMTNGHTVVSYRTKLRGSGKVFSLSIETEPEKDMQLLGWSLIMGMNSNV